MRRVLLVLALIAGVACSKKTDAPASGPAPEPLKTSAGPLRVGVTLHPYYSWTANVIAGVPGAEEIGRAHV